MSKPVRDQGIFEAGLSMLGGSGAAVPGLRGLTVVLADDRAVVRAGLRSLLTSVDWIDVVAETTSSGALREAVLNRPDVLILGHWQQPDSGAVIGEVARCAPEVAVLVFSEADDDSVFTAIRAGARGYLGNTAERDDILRAMSALAAGWVVLTPHIGSRLAAMLSHSTERARPFPELTTREFDVLNLVAGGLSNASIAAELDLAPKTISNHLSRIFTKLGVADRSNAILRAREAGLRPKPERRCGDREPR
ncbi:LuxR C-terminal-related transcriptional regulator [Nocardia sp. NPDC049149]|uniref:LuxR C-terminal-related transcriptional regulator n=1 Tax=Nocardia sp. NPDC049149 TaxID=3364315 RepID=UPI003721FE67